jgi:hypothetical protein
MGGSVVTGRVTRRWRGPLVGACGRGSHSPGEPVEQVEAVLPQLQSDSPLSGNEDRKNSRSATEFHPLSSCRAITTRWIWLVPS